MDLLCLLRKLRLQDFLICKQNQDVAIAYTGCCKPFIPVKISVQGQSRHLRCSLCANTKHTSESEVSVSVVPGTLHLPPSLPKAAQRGMSNKTGIVVMKRCLLPCVQYTEQSLSNCVSGREKGINNLMRTVK